MQYCFCLWSSRQFAKKPVEKVKSLAIQSKQALRGLQDVDGVPRNDLMFDTPEVIVLVHNLSRRRNSYGAKALVAGGVIRCRNDVVKSWWVLNVYVWKSPLVRGSGLWTLSFPHAPEAFPSNIRLLAIFVINPQCGFSGDWRLYCKNPRISLLFRIPSSYNGGHDWQIPDVAIFFSEGVVVSVQLISTSSKWSSVEPVMYCWMRFWHSLRCIFFKPNLCK